MQPMTFWLLHFPIDHLLQPLQSSHLLKAALYSVLNGRYNDLLFVLVITRLE